VADKKARDVMSPDCTCIGERDSILDAAKRLADLGVGALPICGEDDRLKGMLTDRDIVVEVLAVIDDRRLVGIISQADIATNLDEERVGDLVESISAAP
jgi:CBS domain-containing protein